MSDNRKANKASEAQTQKAILQFLAAERIWHMRINTGAMVSEYQGRKRFTRFARPGTADIMAVIHPDRIVESGPELQYVVWIECKSATGKQSEAQVTFQKEVEAAGHIYLLARSVDDVALYLKGEPLA